MEGVYLKKKNVGHYIDRSQQTLIMRSVFIILNELN